MWELQRLTTLWVFTACYRDKFTISKVSVITSVRSVCLVATAAQQIEALKIHGADVILEMQILYKLSIRYPALRGTRRFIIVFSRAHHWILSGAQ
jgi:hypothetical protein